MATEIPDSALKASLSARLRRTGCISNDLFHSDDPDDLIHFLSRMTTPSEALADMYSDQNLQLPGHPSQPNPASFRLGEARIGYKILRGEMCSAKYPTFDFDRTTDRTDTIIHLTLTKHRMGMEKLGSLLLDQCTNAGTLRRAHRAALPEISLRTWEEQIKALQRKTQGWEYELEKLKNPFLYWDEDD